VKTVDFLVVGGGVIGINIAAELRRRFPSRSVTLLEKEAECGLHASGRNSGVIHAGFYYTADSLKAKLTRQGNLLLTAYCDDRRLAINKCGKLVVAKNTAEVAMLDELMRRGRANDVPMELISEDDARKIEPRTKTCGKAIWSPSTSSVNPTEVLRSMETEAVAAGVEIRRAEPYLRRAEGGEVVTPQDTYSAGFVVNAAGLYADRVAHDFGFGLEYRILPFKGLYLYSSEPQGSLRTNIYPVPDLRNPFLGVHFTVGVAGAVKIGPTAMPTLWREHYGGFANFSLPELVEIVGRGTSLLFSANFPYRSLVKEELLKQSRRHMVGLASHLLGGIDESTYRTWGKPGIRAQLLNIRTRKLEMDFVVAGDKKSLHVLNAVSPAFTCSIPFARLVCDQVERSRA
jgi:L-2-hydroxyglutarate oxidase LhgO